MLFELTRMLASSLVAQEDVTPTPGLATSPAASSDCTLGLELPCVQSLGKSCVEKQNQRGLSEGYTIPLFFLETLTFIYPWIKRDHLKKKNGIPGWPLMEEICLLTSFWWCCNTQPYKAPCSPVAIFTHPLYAVPAVCKACKRSGSLDSMPGSFLLWVVGPCDPILPHGPLSARCPREAQRPGSPLPPVWGQSSGSILCELLPVFNLFCKVFFSFSSPRWGEVVEWSDFCKLLNYFKK